MDPNDPSKKRRPLPKGPDTSNKTSDDTSDGLPSRPDAVDWNEKTQVTLARDEDPVEDLFDTLQRAQKSSGAVPRSPEEFIDSTETSSTGPWSALQRSIRNRPWLFGIFSLVLINVVAWALYVWTKPDRIIVTAPSTTTSQEAQPVAPQLPQAPTRMIAPAPPVQAPNPPPVYRPPAPPVDDTRGQGAAPSRQTKIRDPELESPSEFDAPPSKASPIDPSQDDAGLEDPDNPFGD